MQSDFALHIWPTGK